MTLTCISDDDLLFEAWLSEYEPRVNPSELRPGSFDDRLYDHAYMDQLEEVLAAGNAHTWTLMEATDVDGFYIVPGYYTVNRFGYFICKKAWTDGPLPADIFIDCTPDN